MKEKTTPETDTTSRPRIEWTRRQFLGWSAVAGAGLALSRPLAASSAPGFNLGLVGLGERGCGTLASCRALAESTLDRAQGLPRIRVAAACDPRRAALGAVPADVVCFTDLRSLLARADIDALVLTVPESAATKLLPLAVEASKPVLLARPVPELSLAWDVETGSRIEVVPGLHLSSDRALMGPVESRDVRAATLELTAPSPGELAEQAPEALEMAWTLLGGGRVADLRAIGGPGLMARQIDVRGAIRFEVDEPEPRYRRLDVRLRVRPRQRVSGRLAVGSRVEGVTSGLMPRASLAPTPHDLVAFAAGRASASLGLSLRALARGRDLYRRLVAAVS